MRLPLSASVRSRRGALSQGCLVGLALGALLLGVGAWLVSRYNALATNKTTISAAWARIDSQYKNRADLIPQLVDVVKGAANFEQTTLKDLVEARASVGRVQMPANLPDNSAQLKQYMEAQQALTNSLSRLLVVSENYPQLKASEAFLGLQSQVEGINNRINVARIDYIEAVRAYDQSRVTFPGSLIAGLFHFEAVPQLESATPEERQVPKIDFGTK